MSGLVCEFHAYDPHVALLPYSNFFEHYPCLSVLNVLALAT